MPLPKRQTIAAPHALSAARSSDSRFATFETDPKFQLPSKKHARTKLDPRFATLRTDPDFYNKASVDKYGRRIAKDAGRRDMERLYQVSDDEGDARLDKERKRDKAVLKELAKVEKQGFDPIRDGGLSSSSDESASEEDEDEEQQIEEQAELAGQENQVPTGEVTSRLAAVNLDWDNIRASDIMAVANSFVPAGGRILNVVIYPSEFGMERLQREEIEGPPREIFASTADRNSDNLTSLTNLPEASDEDRDDETKDTPTKEENGEEFDPKALRNYQLDRLRYYYAVMSCSSPNVAKSIYDNLDGREYLASANFFDLRFVPDEVTFDEDPHDECEKLPTGYKPNDFTTDALTHSKVKLTWDADDKTRKEAQKRAFSRKEIDENELQAYLGSDSSTSEDEAETARTHKAASLRAALGLEPSSKSSKPKTKSSAKRDRDFPKPEGEMQITFSAGLSGDASKGSVFENEPEETTLERYVRKQRERKAKRKERAKAVREGRDPDAEIEPEPAAEATKAEQDPWNDPFFESDPDSAKNLQAESRKAQKLRKREEREKQEKEAAEERANLELLMLDDEGSKVRHFDMNEIAKAEKAKKKGKKGKRIKAPAVEDDFKIETNDPRFAKLYESHEFAIDPTNPRYKDTTGMKALLEEGRKKRKHDSNRGEELDVERKKLKKLRKQGEPEADDLKRLAARVKAKSMRI